MTITNIVGFVNLIRKLSAVTVSLALVLSASAWAEKVIEPIDEVFIPKTSPFKQGTYGKVAVVQWAPSGYAPLPASPQQAESWKQGNRETLEEYIREAAENGAELIITPEFGSLGYPDIPELPEEDDNFRTRADIKPYVETAQGNTFKFFSKLAKELKAYIHFGFAEVDPKTNKYYNSAMAVDPRGKMVALHRKAHLFELEHGYLSEGDSITTYKGPFGKVGLIICSDVYGSFPMNEYAEAGLDVMALSTSWAEANTGWGYFTRGARWVDAYFLAANQNYFPDSGVINPDGSTQSHIRQTTGIAYGYLPYRK